MSSRDAVRRTGTDGRGEKRIRSAIATRRQRSQPPVKSTRGWCRILLAFPRPVSAKSNTRRLSHGVWLFTVPGCSPPSEGAKSMAIIISGIALSHLNHRLCARSRQQDDPVWKPVNGISFPVRGGSQQAAGRAHSSGDHITSFFFDHYCRSCSASTTRYEVADEAAASAIV